ncbi:MAG: ABC transporter permease [Acidimicrobiales bacterium]|nr:ABC transporter permease [Acidimicrobiales bacterium]
MSTGTSAAAPAARLWPVSWSIARRSLLLIARVPSTFVPTLVMPLFFVLAFTGAFSAIVNLPGFPTDSITDWFVPFAAVQGAAIGGVTIGYGTIRDIETRFIDRLLSSPAPRGALVVGPLVAGVLRAFLPMTVVLLAGALVGLALPGGALAVALLYLAGAGTALVAGAYALGLAFRIQSQQAAPLIQFGIFLTIFLSTAQVPLSAMSGWLEAVATVNPVTQILDLARAGFVGPVTWGEVWPGLLALAALGVVSVAFAARGLRRLVP